MSIIGTFLVPTPKNPDKGLWLIFHHEPDGILAYDLTSEHPDIPFHHFEPLLDNADVNNPARRTVLRGGPLQDDSALIILHDKPDAADDVHILTPELCFHSFRFKIIKGRGQMEKADESPARLNFSPATRFQLILGFRLWEMADLEQELKDWQWTMLPATADLVFNTPCGERLEKARRQIN